MSSDADGNVTKKRKIVTAVVDLCSDSEVETLVQKPHPQQKKSHQPKKLVTHDIADRPKNVELSNLCKDICNILKLDKPNLHTNNVTPEGEVWDYTYGDAYYYYLELLSKMDFDGQLESGLSSLSCMEQKMENGSLDNIKVWCFKIGILEATVIVFFIVKN